MQYPKHVESRTSTHSVDTIEWNPGMDLLAAVFKQEILTCSRLLGLQKVWHKQGNGYMNCMAWRPDGRVLAIGAYHDKTRENVCTLHDVENGNIIFTIHKNRTITAISWFKEDASREKLDSDLINTSVFSHQLARDQTQLTILTISTEDGITSFYALGLFHIGDIVIHNDSHSKSLQTHMSQCLRYFSSIISSRSGISLKVIELDTFHSRSNEILKVAKMYAKITDELEFLGDTMNAITTSWADVLAGLDNKLSSYCSRKNRNNDSMDEKYTFLSADELLQLLVVGFPSDNLEKFLVDMSDKGLKKLNSAIEQTCLRVQNLIVKNAQKCCYHVHRDLDLLRDISLQRDMYSKIGMDDKPFVEAMKSVGSFMLKLTEMNQVIDHSLKSARSFFKWLISIAFRISGEQNSNVSDTNKMTQQDIELIQDFILDNFDYNSSDDLSAYISLDDDFANRPTCSNFTLEQVGQYLKNESLTRLKYSFAKHDTNFWIEFYKQRPELTETRELDGASVFVLYPHNPQTSLIQEHKRSTESIANAFKSVAENIKLVPNEDSVDSGIYLKDFLRNNHITRVPVETDYQSSKHYTLFQMETSPVNKQYLISQNLSERTFQLASIQFLLCDDAYSNGSQNRIFTRTSLPNNLMISDSCFYEDKDNKTQLLTFLLIQEHLDNTVIVQLSVDYFFETFECVERLSKDIGKVFKSNESIEKLSTPTTIRIDLSSDVGAERRHDPENIMVKRIKGTKGETMYASSNRGVIAFTSSQIRRIHLYEFESSDNGPEIMDDEEDGDDQIDESLMEGELCA